jgi:methylphosphotriester-DNA--protein-cysteine methyltransferase
MWSHSQLTTGQIKNLIHTGEILFGGNMKLRIYGTLSCGSGKRMKKQNRVFFADETEAKDYGFRPCGHCLRKKYLQWIAQESG